MSKNLTLGLIRVANFFFKSLALSITRYHGQLSTYKILERVNYPILRKFSEGQTDGQMDKQPE